MTDLIEVLFGRLLWPSVFARESAVKAIADLLAHHEIERGDIFQWMAQQPLESSAAYGLLPLLLLKRNYPQFSLLEREVFDGLTFKRSLLSDYLVSMLIGDEYASDRYDFIDSDPEDGFVPNPDFEDYLRSLMPPVLEHLLQRASVRSGEDLLTRWAFEWQHLSDTVPAEDAHSVTSFGGYADRERYESFLPLQGEIYRSAYLRTVAWAVSSGTLEDSFGRYVARLLCPLSFELMELRPVKRPDWWPIVVEEDARVDARPAAIVSQLETTLSSFLQCNDDWIPTYATGTCYESDSLIYRLTISAVLQKTKGPVPPSADSLRKWLLEAPDSMYLTNGTSCNTVSEGIPKVNSGGVEIIDDWEVLPVSTCYHADLIPTWRIWLLIRGPWLPTTWLVSSPLKIEYHDRFVGAYQSDALIGKWEWWPNHFSERVVANLPPSFGGLSTMSGKLLREFMEENAVSLCYVCTIETFSREYDYGMFKESEFDFVVGGSHLISMMSPEIGTGS